jgi:hypothetical protein
VRSAQSAGGGYVGQIAGLAVRGSDCAQIERSSFRIGATHLAQHAQIAAVTPSRSIRA